MQSYASILYQDIIPTIKVTQSSFNLHNNILGVIVSKGGNHGNKYDLDFQPEIWTKGKNKIYKKGNNLNISYGSFVMHSILYLHFMFYWNIYILHSCNHGPDNKIFSPKRKKI